MPSTTHCLAELRHLLLRRYLPASVTNPQRFVTDAGCGSGTLRLRRKIPLLFGEESLNFKNSGVRSCRSSGDEYLVESTASRVEIVIAWRLINHHPQTEKPPFHSATPELLQLLTSSFDPMLKSFLARNELVASAFACFLRARVKLILCADSLREVF